MTMVKGFPPSPESVAMGSIVFAPDRPEQPASVSPAKITAHLAVQREAESMAALRHQVDTMVDKMRKVAAWLDRLADSAEESAKTCRFGSLVAAYQGDARNYRATAKDIRSVLPTEEGAG